MRTSRLALAATGLLAIGAGVAIAGLPGSTPASLTVVVAPATTTTTTTTTTVPVVAPEPDDADDPSEG